ncbi:MAG: IclR family transcriptional regulator [Burkholderiales bacterium]
MPKRTSAINSVQKACRILRSLTEPNVGRLSEVANEARLNKVTTLRILEVLSREGFVHRDEKSKTYSLGNEVLILSAALQDRDDLRIRARPSLLRLAAACGDSVMLSVPSGAMESVCVDRVVGDFPIRANYVELGSRRPLGVGAGPMVLLAWRPAQEIEAILPMVVPRLGEYPKIKMDWLKKEIRDSRERGYTLFRNMLVDRMSGVGVPVLRPDGRLVGALSIAAITERITSRLRELVDMLQKESTIITESWSSRDN